MQITLENKELGPTISFLERMNLKANKDSRHRSKLVKCLREAFSELSEEEKELMAKHDLLTEDGELKPENERDPKSVAAFNRDQADLMAEEVVIEGGMYARNIDEIPRILEAYEEMLSGEDAIVYDRLLDEFEK